MGISYKRLLNILTVLVLYNNVLFVKINGLNPFSSVYCKYYECCNERWINFDLPNLEQSLNKDVMGQHIAIKTLMNSLKAHTRHESTRSLVFSFQGPIGTGKNLVSDLIVRNRYKNGRESKYFQYIHGASDFTGEETKSFYQNWIKAMVETNLAECPHQTFVFDEVDDMPDGVLDGLMTFVGKTNKKAYRGAIFLFLSNTGSAKMIDKSYEHHKSGRDRWDLEIKDVEHKLLVEVLNGQGGLKNSKLITSILIDAYIPFLPLERDHVEVCIRKDIMERYPMFGERRIRDITERVMERTVFYKHAKIYSSTGCKQVYSKVNEIAEEYFDNYLISNDEL